MTVDGTLNASARSIRGVVMLLRGSRIGVPESINSANAWSAVSPLLIRSAAAPAAYGEAAEVPPKQDQTSPTKPADSAVSAQ